MKFLNYFLGASLIIFSFSSCKKETSPQNNNAQLKLKTYTEDVTSAALGHKVETFNVNYDNENRLISLQSVSASGGKFVYDYTSANSFTMDIFTGDALTIHETFFINGMDLVDSTIQYNDTQDSTAEKYIYNSGKQLIKMYQYDIIDGVSHLDNTTTYSYDNNGNLVGESDTYSTITYSYDQVILNTVTVAPVYFQLPKQLPTKTEYTSGSDTYSADHTYTFDTNNRLTSDKTVLSNGDIVIKSYTYF